MCFPRGTTTLDEGLKKKRQGKVPQRNWKQSFAARICSLQKTFPLLTEGRPSPRNLSFCHPSQHEILNPKGKTNMYVFCVTGRKAVLIVSFFAYSCQKEHLPQVTVMCLGGELCFPVLGTKTDGLYSGTEVWEQVFFCSWRYMRLPPAQASKSTGILNCKIKIHQRN